MTKIMISMLLLLNLNLFADLIDDGSAAYNKGDIILANKLYLQACKNGSSRGCLKSGLLYFTGTDVKKNIIKTIKKQEPIFPQLARGVSRKVVKNTI